MTVSAPQIATAVVLTACAVWIWADSRAARQQADAQRADRGADRARLVGRGPHRLTEPERTEPAWLAVGGRWLVLPYGPEYPEAVDTRHVYVLDDDRDDGGEP